MRPIDPKRLSSIVADIAESLWNDRRQFDEPGLAAGTAGVALFFGYLSLNSEDVEDKRRARHFARKSLNAISTTRLSPGLFQGLTGISWVWRHLLSLGVIANTNETADLLEHVDIAVTRALTRAPVWSSGFDLVSGLAGMILHSLSVADAELRRSSLEAVIQQLRACSLRFPDATAWFTPVEHLGKVNANQFPEGCFDLGVAHGVAGVIGALALAQSHHPSDLTASLLYGASKWLLDRADVESPDGACGHFWLPHRRRERGRIAWCYGDAAVAAMLFQASKLLGEATWRSAAVTLALRAASRPRDESGIIDAGFCHGAVGAAHIFHRFHDWTGAAVFREREIDWLNVVLEMRNRRSVGGIGYQTYGGEAKGWFADYSLLTGIAGVALVLLGALNSVEPTWDEVLLLRTKLRFEPEIELRRNRARP